MKKFLKLLVFIFIAFFVISVGNFMKNYIIINKIFSLQNSFDIGSNYLIKLKTYSELSTSSTELYMKDNIYLQKIFIDNELSEITFHNLNTNEFLSYSKNSNNNLELVQNSEHDNYKHIIDALTPFKTGISKSELLKVNTFNFINYINNCYQLNTPYGEIEFIDKETGLLMKNVKNNKTLVEISFQKDIVTDEDLKIDQNQL